MKTTKLVSDLQKVESSNIDSIAYEEGSLFVQFKTGLYRYDKVPVGVYEDLKKSESKGKFMNGVIKGAFDYEKVELDIKLKETPKMPEIPSIEQIKESVIAEVK